MSTTTTIKSAVSRIAAAIVARYKTGAGQPALGPAATPNINALLLNLCDGDRDRALWVLRWLAYPLRNEGAKMATALLVSGVSGSGKSLFFEQVIKPLYGNRAITPRQPLNSQFNDWMNSKLFVLIDELRLSPSIAPRVKQLISSPTILINTKGYQEKVERNSMNFVFMSGAATPLNDDTNDRRFMVIAPRKALPQAVYAGVAQEIATGGIEAFHHFLLQQLDTDDFCTRTAPLNKKSTMKEAA